MSRAASEGLIGESIAGWLRIEVPILMLFAWAPSAALAGSCDDVAPYISQIDAGSMRQTVEDLQQLGPRLIYLTASWDWDRCSPMNVDWPAYIDPRNDTFASYIVDPTFSYNIRQIPVTNGRKNCWCQPKVAECPPPLIVRSGDGRCLEPDGTLHIDAANSTYQRSAELMRNRFAAMGYVAILEAQPLVCYGAQADGWSNVVAFKPGSMYPWSTIEIGAHLDSVFSAPGANDNAVGVAAVMEIAKALIAYPNRHSIRFVLYAAEEACQSETGSTTVSMAHLVTSGMTDLEGLVMDGIGFRAPSPQPSNSNFMNCAVAGCVGGDALVAARNASGDCGLPLALIPEQDPDVRSDEGAFITLGVDAIGSFGGFTPRVGHHDCDDIYVTDGAASDHVNIDFTFARAVAQLNLAAAIRLDQRDHLRPAPWSQASSVVFQLW
jgi:hypothetical protein